MTTANTPAGDNRFRVAPHRLETGILDEPTAAVRRKNYPQKHLFSLRNVMSPAECAKLIELAEQLGFQPAGLATGDDTYRVKERTRNNLRVMFEDTSFAEGLWARVADHVERRFQNHVAVGLNWRFRVYKYPPGSTFAPHVDNRTPLPDGRITLFSFMIYLNHNFRGGETTFFERRRAGQKKLTMQRSIRPRTGAALVFDHLLYHEGSLVVSGHKYAVRSDVVYQPK